MPAVLRIIKKRREKRDLLKCRAGLVVQLPAHVTQRAGVRIACVSYCSGENDAGISILFSWAVS